MNPEQLLRNDTEFLEVFGRLGSIPRSSATEAAQRDAVKATKTTCAVCGKKPDTLSGKVLMGAHIVPHEEGGSHHPMNLICLCVIRQSRSLNHGATVDQVGCHDLFDNYQVWTRREMSTLRKSLRTPKHLEHSRNMLQTRAKWVKKMTDPVQLALK